MQEAFAYVLFGVVGIGALLAVASLFIKTKTYDEIGQGGFFKESDAPRSASQDSQAVVDEEIRQLLRARNARHEQTGGEMVDVESELQRLKAPAHDPALEAEVRELVIARNARRARKGQPPLDVEEEVARQLRELGA
jgi:plasmid stability protein